MQSVKPPVEAPTSMLTLPSRETPKLFMAFSSFRPPRLTYGSVFPRTSIFTVSWNMVPALSSFCPFTYTSPDMIYAFAFSLEGASARSTIKRSSLFFIVAPHIPLLHRECPVLTDRSWPAGFRLLHALQNGSRSRSEEHVLPDDRLPYRLPHVRRIRRF